MAAPTLQPVDLADAWLACGLERLLDACAADEAPRRLEASRLTVLFAALAVESRINRVVREHDPEGWHSDVRRSPLEKYQLVPRLVHESELDRHNELSGLVVELLDLRDELVDAAEPTVSIDPHVACTTLAAGAELCLFLDRGDETARTIGETASGLGRRARAAAAVTGGPDDWSDFPPDIVGA